MKIKVIGKQHKVGTSQKTNNAYDFSIVHFVGNSPWVEGECGQSINVDPSLMPFSQIRIGASYEVQFGPYNRITDFVEIKS